VDITKKCSECGKVWCVNAGGGPNTDRCPWCHPKKSDKEIIREQEKEIYELKRRLKAYESAES